MNARFHLPGTLALLALATTATAQVPGVSREQMWPAPSEDDWAKPVQITFQRTWEDAIAVSQETGKPILICVNMDGEIASEHYAGIRYRDPEIAKLYEPYVCVIASVYRHTPRDHDEHGHRVICPRFGSVTCGEHIQIEPPLYEKFFDGTRVAPRHIMVELDGEETYDVYYAFDTQSVFDTIQKGVEGRELPPPQTKGDRTLAERVASRDIDDRKAVEQAYQQGDTDLRKALLAAAAEHPDASPLDLLRLAVFGLDPELAELARTALAKTSDTKATWLIAEALRVPMQDGDRDALIEALQRIGNGDPQAKTLAVVHKGLASKSDKVDTQGWSSALEGGASYAPAHDYSDLAAKVDHSEAKAAAEPADPAAKLDAAEANLELAVDPKTGEILGTDRKTASKYARLMLEDALRDAREAEQLGATGWRLNATIALASYYLGNYRVAYQRAIQAAPDIPAGSEKWSAIATLALFAQARQNQINHAQRRRQDWPGEWLTDVNAAYAVLAKHPLGRQDHIVAHYDFLQSVGARLRAEQVLQQGLARFPDSWELHSRYRDIVVFDNGIQALEPAYQRMLTADDPSPNLEWFAGYASIVAAEFHRRANDFDQALEAYDRALRHYDRAIETNPSNQDNSDYYAAIALAGKARIAYERADYQGCLADLTAGITRSPDATPALDGMNLSAAETARMLLVKLKELNQPELLQQLEATMATLSPAQLSKPEYDQNPGPPPQNGGWNPRRRR